MAVSRRVAWAAMLASALSWTSPAAAASDAAGPGSAPVVMAPDARVRGMDDRLLALINDGTVRSKTFRMLVDEIGTTDGFVYIVEGRCPATVRACLLWTITTMGQYRVLRILVDARGDDRDLIGSIGHELHHAVEVLSHRQVTTDSGIASLYHRIGSVRGRSIETEAAIKAGDAVRKELRQGADH
jgi:hypothetical protein